MKSLTARRTRATGRSRADNLVPAACIASRSSMTCSARLLAALAAFAASAAHAGLTTNQSTLDFGVAGAQGFREAVLSVTNSGAERFFGEADISNDAFWLQQSSCDLAFGIDPGASCALTLRFSAPQPCAYQAELTIMDKVHPQQQYELHVGLTGAGAADAPGCSAGQLNAPGRWVYVEGPEADGSDAGTIVTVADLGGDGEMDAIIVLMPYISNFPAELYHEERVDEVRVLTLNAQGQYLDTTQRWFGVAPLLVPNLFTAYVADLNGDGKDDVAFGATNEDGRPFSVPDTSEPLWYTRNYEFLSTQTDAYDVLPLTDLRQTAYGITGGDIDGDGDIDLYVCGPFFLINDGSGHFTYQTFSPVGAPSSPDYGNICAATLTDLDGDDKPDLAAGRVQDGRVAIFRNQNGTFAYQRDVTAFPGVRDNQAGTYILNFGFDQALLEGVTGIASADLDGDGLKDLVAYGGGGLLHQSFFAPTSGLRVLGGVGGLDFQALKGFAELTTMGQSLGAQILPLNNGGGLDLVIRAQTSTATASRIQIRGDGRGNFSFENILAFPAREFGRITDAIHVADMDRDGRYDVVANRNVFGGPSRRGIFLNRASSEQLADSEVVFQNGFE